MHQRKRIAKEVGNAPSSDKRDFTPVWSWMVQEHHPEVCCLSEIDGKR